MPRGLGRRIHDRGAKLFGGRPATVARSAVLKQVATQNETVLEVVEVGDVDRNALVVDDGKVAVGGRLAEPDLEQMPSFTGTYATDAYPTTAFSSADYDSPQKQQMIQLLSQEQARGVHLGAAGSH